MRFVECNILRCDCAHGSSATRAERGKFVVTELCLVRIAKLANSVSRCRLRVLLLLVLALVSATTRANYGVSELQQLHKCPPVIFPSNVIDDSHTSSSLLTTPFALAADPNSLYHNCACAEDGQTASSHIRGIVSPTNCCFVPSRIGRARCCHFRNGC